MTTQFTPGDVVYDDHGFEYEYVSSIDGGHVVRAVASDEDGAAFPVEEVRVIRRIFAAPPIARVNGEVLAAQEKLRAVNTEIAEMSRELSRLKRDVLARIAELSKLSSAVARIEDFIHGRITHIVFDFSIGTVAELKEQAYPHDQKLVCLFGRTNGDLEWRVNDYHDGSGWWTTIIPCHSESEAREVLQARINAAAGDAANVYRSRLALNASVKYGLTFPKDALARIRTADVNAARKAVEFKTKEFDDAVAQLAKVEAT